MKADVDAAFDTLSTILCDAELSPEIHMASIRARDVILSRVEELEAENARLRKELIL